MGILTRNYVTFFKELAANNNREWFKENKKRYEDHVKDPFYELTRQVISRMQKLDPEIKLEPKDAVFRIYRDTRFSKDKTPYKLHMSAVVGRGGRRDHTYPGIYFQIGVAGLTIAGGSWKPDKERLYRIRALVTEDPKRFRRIIDAPKFKEAFGELEAEKNKIIPKEFRETAEVVPEIYNKSFHYMADYKAQKDVMRDDLDKFIVDHYKIASKLNDFLIETI
jgi:uncharacterized protein (TIGR02453 family)